MTCALLTIVLYMLFDTKCYNFILSPLIMNLDSYKQSWDYLPAVWFIMKVFVVYKFSYYVLYVAF